jgi:hypothetical protein
VRLGDREARPVPPRASAAPGGERQTQRAQFVTERKARGVDGCCIQQRLLRLGGHFGMAELRGGLLSLGGIAVVATEREVGHPMGATATAWLDMVQFEGRVRSPAIGAPAPELLQKTVGASRAGDDG